MINVGFLIAAIVSFLAFIGLVIIISLDDSDNEGSVVSGLGLAELLFLTILFACSVPKPKIYYNKYIGKISDTKEYRVDTTFTTTNGVTDTTYTIYYNKVEE